ncbi:MAG: TonB-dependent receptor domain-containing protein [Chitinophagales bacterium]
MKNHFLFIVSFILINCSFAQNAVSVVKGKVEDAATGEALIGATVILSNHTGAATGIDGNYEFVTLPGLFSIKASYVGYITDSNSIELSAGSMTEINFTLNMEEGILNTVVVTGSKFEKKLGEETVSIDVIKSSLIENTNDQKLDQTLQRMPGVCVIDGQANIRGGSGYSYGAGSRVLLLMDDLPMLTGDAAFTSWDFIPIENIQQVEIIKGASSALYGSSALNGIINVRSAYPTSTPETKISVFNGVYFTPKDTAQKWWADDFPFGGGFSISHRQKFGRFDLVTGAYGMNQDSYLKDIYSRRARANVNMRYRINNNLAVGVNVNTQLSRSATFFFWASADTGLLIPAPNTIAINRGYKITIDPYFNYYDKKGNRHKILTRYYGNHNSTLTTDQSNFNDLFYGEYQYQKHFDKINMVLTGGALASYTNVSAEIYGDSLFHSSNEAAYLQFDKKFFKKLNTSGGVRYEFNQIEGLEESRPVFRLGANYQLAEFTYLRASWGQGYRFPTIAEKYISTRVSLLTIFPNPDLKSENGWSAEIGLKQGFKISNWRGYADISGFINEYFDMMEFTFDFYDIGSIEIPGFKSLNIGNTKIIGTELSVFGEGKFGNIPTTLIAGYTFIDPKFQEFDSLQNESSSADHNVLKYRFRHTGKLDAESTIKKFRVGVTYNYYSFMEAVDAAFVDPVIDLPGEENDVYIIDGLQDYRDAHNNGDHVVDLRVAFLFNDANEISVVCNNLFNREYMLRPAIIEPTRNLMIKYAVKL